MTSKLIRDKKNLIVKYLAKRSMTGKIGEIFLICISKDSKYFGRICLVGSCDKSKNYKVPDFVTDLGVIDLDELLNNADRYRYYGPKESANNCVFSDTLIESIELGKETEYIHDTVFSSCKTLKSVILNTNLKYIGNWAFYNCINLESIDINKIKDADIKNSSFIGCNKIDLRKLYKYKEYR